MKLKKISLLTFTLVAASLLFTACTNKNQPATQQDNIPAVQNLENQEQNLGNQDAKQNGTTEKKLSPTITVSEDHSLDVLEKELKETEIFEEDFGDLED